MKTSEKTKHHIIDLTTDVDVKGWGEIVERGILNFSIDFEPVSIICGFSVLKAMLWFVGEHRVKTDSELAGFIEGIKSPNFAKRINKYVDNERKENINKFCGCISFDKAFWQTIINLTCELLNKEHRYVFWERDNIRGNFIQNGCVSEYISNSYNHGVYLMNTKIHHVNKFYDGIDAVFNYLEKDKYRCSELLSPRAKDEIRAERDKLFEKHKYFISHFENVHLHLCKDGVVSSKAFYEPDTKTIDLLIKKLKQHGNIKRTTK